MQKVIVHDAPSPCFPAVPIDSTAGIKMLYVFVDIELDTAHFMDTVQYNFIPGQSLALVSTIQFVAALQVTPKALILLTLHFHLLTHISPALMNDGFFTSLLS